MRLIDFLKVLTTELRKFPRLAAILTAVSIGLPLVEIYVPFLLGKILNIIVLNDGASNQTDSFFLIGLFFAANIFKAGLTAIQLRLGFAFDANISEGVRSRFLRATLAGSSQAFKPALSSITMHLQSLSKFWGTMFWETLTSVLFMVGASIALFIIDQRLALIAFVPVPVVLAVVLFLGPRFRRTMQAYLAGSDALGQELLEVSENQDFIKVSGVASLVTKIFERNNRKLTLRAKAFGFWAAMYAPIFDFVAAAATGLLVVAFVAWSSTGSVDQKTFLIFFVYLSYFYRPLYGASALSDSWQKTFLAYDSFAGMDSSVQLVEHRQSKSQEKIKNLEVLPTRTEFAVRFEGVSFSYPNSLPVISDLSAEIPVGQRCAIIGGNGLGKSTLIKLMVGLNVAQTGRIVLGNGISSFAYLPQTVFLHSGSILDNLLLVHPSYGLDIPERRLSDIVQSIYAVGERIGVLAKLPKINLRDAELGVGKNQLSGGQRQLVGLWRFAVQAEFSDILVMDEPDAYLDIDGLNQVLPLIFDKYREKTVVIVSHNFKILEMCDRVLRIENGTLLEKKGV